MQGGTTPNTVAGMAKAVFELRANTPGCMQTAVKKFEYALEYLPVAFGNPVQVCIEYPATHTHMWCVYSIYY